MSETEKIKIIYLMGMGRSGGTIIGRLLGQMRNSVYIGELRYLWQRGFIENWRCSCGEKFSNCDFWQSVIKDINILDKSIFMVKEIHDKYDKTSRYFNLIVNKLLNRKRFFEPYCRYVEEVYEGISSKTGKNIIVESSRYPSRAISLSCCDKFEIYVIHLIRDPRGVIYSQQKEDKRKSGEYKIFPLKRIIHWIVTTILSFISQIILKNNVLIKYENFVDKPELTLKMILNKFYLQANYIKQIDEIKEVDLKKIHVFSANENRSISGKIKIKKDEKWKTEMDKRTYLFTTIFTLPLLVLLGYKIK